jgi:hypothetical protein
LTRAFYRFYWWLQRLIAPGLRYCLEEYEDVLAATVKKETGWLDLGCGHNVLPAWRAEQEQALTRRPAQLVGLDRHAFLRNHHSIRSSCAATSRASDFATSFNLVTSSIFEHPKNPRAQLGDRRVMSRGGELIFLTPNDGYDDSRADDSRVPKARVIHFFRSRRARRLSDVLSHQLAGPDRAMFARAASRPRIRLIPSAAQFVKIPPLVFFELLWIRLTMTKRLEALRTNVIVRCVKPTDVSATRTAAA